MLIEKGGIMRPLNVCVAAKDMDYGMALCGSLMDWNNRFIPELMSAGGADGRDLSGFDLVIYDHDPSVMPDNGILLVDDPADASADDLRFFKYGNAKLLGGELLFAYGRMTGRDLSVFDRGDVKIYSVCGSRPGAGSTSVAIALARELKRFRHRRVFFVSCDEIEPAHEFMEPAGGRTSREFLYYLISGREGMYSCLENFLCRDPYGLESFSPAPGRNPVLTLSGGGREKLLDFLAHCGRYDVIIFDIGNRLSEGAVSFMDASDKVIVINGQENLRRPDNWFLDEDSEECEGDEGSGGADESAADACAGLFGSCLREMTDCPDDAVISVMNKCGRAPGSGLFLPADEESFRVCAGRKDIAADGAFGTYISMLGRELTRKDGGGMI